MLLLSSTDLAIALSAKRGTLELTERVGRFGPYVAVCDDHGIIEVADDMAAARKRVQECTR